jgi:hypothetical protein
MRGCLQKKLKMLKTIQQSCGVSEEVAQEWLDMYGEGDEHKAAEKILELGEASDAIFKKKDKLEKAVYSAKLAKWDEGKRGFDSFLREASTFELYVTLKVNPTYPCLAFRIPYKTCLDLATHLKFKLSDDMLQYAIMIEELQHKHSLTDKQARDLVIHKHGLRFKEPRRLKPFPADLLDDHVLRDINPSKHTPADLIANYATKNPLQVIRERKEMTNRIEIVPTDNEEIIYKVMEGEDEAFRMIKKLHRRVAY